MGKRQRIFKREQMNECLQMEDKQKKGEGDDDGSEELGGDWGEVHEGEDWTTSWC